MASSRISHAISRFAFATTSTAAGLLWATAALASQGPGGGPGTAGISPTGDGCCRPWSVGAGGRRRADRRREAAKLTAAPVAAHARHDHRAARPVFLHVGCAAIPHRIAAGIIPGIDAVGSRFVTRIDAQARQRPPDTALRGYLGRQGLRRLRRPHPLRRGLRLGSGCGQRKNPCQSQQYCRCPDPHHDAHPNLLWTVRSPIAAPTSTGREIQLQNRYAPLRNPR